ncbi:2-oxo acid dehydrogenase subunit E2 [Carboxylicivirga mesophila]|uniref:Dihydrolipoamide acetyltransferase component of pyruvate dehydrogenase complex n=1 Tax=Carboxylicivirga mesophila TaxID=1166478 RepID=A0ABS5KAX1_9BACT|nr:dihydrolipoamide acetyltransferase family protein [Carboxylicivirga mesophila]MBS2212174.1 2-oxo acid dehydrogenase subunit E2 [Carboxylicivirga mesophila]
MSTFEILMPKMGESVEEATITKWFVSEGDTIQEDDVLLEIATDKVDSEIPSPVAGTVKEIKYQVDDVVAVGLPVAVILLEGAEDTEEEAPAASAQPAAQASETTQVAAPVAETADVKSINADSDRFYSPLVRSMASQEGIGADELEKIPGTGKDGRVTKADMQNYIASRGQQAPQPVAVTPAQPATQAAAASQPSPAPKEHKVNVSVSANDEIVEMGRMRKLIADHMVMSKQVSPHVTSVVEADVTNMVLWRTKIKDAFQKKYGEKITYMPIITEAVAKALRDFPGVNASVDGDKIILRKNVNVGMAVSLPSGDLIVPVIKNADQKNLVGLTGDVNRLANEARANKLSADDIQGGTFTITNFGSFKNIIGTPIINQPQVAILATGSIEKKPAVIETPTGDVIGICHKMFLSLSYDHRIVDGALGGAFLRRIGDYLEAFDINTEI